MYESIIKEAQEKAHLAFHNAICTPMLVGQGKSLFSNEIDHSKPTYVVNDGICGNASIKFKANTKFAKWAIKNGVARKSCMGGAYIRNPMCSQSYTRNCAYAEAYVKVLSENGIEARVDSYVD